MQHAFGESTKNTIPYLMFESKNDMYELEEIDLNLPRKKIVYMDIEDIDTYEKPETDDTIKLTLKGNYEQFKAIKKTKKYKQLVEKGLKIVFKANQKNQEEQENMNVSDGKVGNFNEILKGLIEDTKDRYLNQTYELVVNNREVELDSIMYI